MSEHYTAHVRMEKVVKPEPRTTSRGYPADGAAPEREVIEVLHVNVRAGTLDALKAKVNAHVDLAGDQ